MMKNWNIEKLNDRSATNARQTMKTRNGKIARLPHHVREELNVRLERSERSPRLSAWLNFNPEGIASFSPGLARFREGLPWDNGGFQSNPVAVSRSQSQ